MERSKLEKWLYKSQENIFDLLLENSAYASKQENPHAFIKDDRELLYAPNVEFIDLLAINIFFTILASITSTAIYARFFASKKQRLLRGPDLEQVKSELLPLLSKYVTPSADAAAASPPRGVLIECASVLKHHGWPHEKAMRDVLTGSASVQGSLAALRGSADAEASWKRPARRDLRLLLDAAIRDDSQLDAFCMDYFPRTKRRFSNNMDRVAKLNLLIESEPLEHIVLALKDSVS